MVCADGRKDAFSCTCQVVLRRTIQTHTPQPPRSLPSAHVCLGLGKLLGLESTLGTTLSAAYILQ